MTDIKKIVANAAVNAELENNKLSDETIEMIENCLKTEDGSFLFHLYLQTRHDNDKEDVVLQSVGSKYCYDNGVLINKFNIKSLELLHIVESDSAAYYQSQVVSGNSDYKFSFTVDGYLNLHKKLFSNVYDFAGEIRDEFIYKSCEPYFDRKTPFCMPQYIYNSLFYILSEMRKKFISIRNRDDLVKYLAYYYGELNMIHPFREGNGRVLRTYFLLLVHELNKYIFFDNFEIDYSLWDDNNKADLIKYTIINSINGDIDGIISLFDKVLVENNEKKRVRK